MDIQSRRSIVRELYELGLSTGDITRLLNFTSVSVAVNDIKIIGQTTTFPNRPKKASEVFPAVLQGYFKERRTIRVIQHVSEKVRVIFEAMENFLGLKEGEKELVNLAHFYNCLTIPQCQEHQRPYLRLVCAIFKWPVQEDPSGQLISKFDWRDLFDEYAKSAADNKQTLATLRSPQSLQAAFIQWLAAQCRQRQGACWEQDDEQLISSALTDLTPKERISLSLYYGLDGTPGKTLEEVGESLSVGKERARQIKAIALRKLRQPSKKMVFQSLFHASHLFGHLRREQLRLWRKELKQPAKDGLTRFLTLTPADQSTIEEVSDETILVNETVEQKRLRFLLASVDHLDRLPIRPVNCLKNNDIRLIGQLVQINPGVLLRMKNFGRQSLIDVNDSLDPLGFKIGMVLKDEEKAAIQEAVDTLAMR